MVYETHESRKMTEIADAINDIMQSGETAQNGDEVANMPPRHAEYSTPASQKPPQAKTRPAADEINDKANNDIDIDDTPIADSPMPDSSMPDSSVSAVRTEAAEQAEMGASEGMERAENDLSQAENSLPHKIDESTPDPTASQTDFAVYGDNENIEQNAEQNNNTDIEAGLEAAIAAEIASDPIAQQTLNKAANNESSNESNNDWHGETNGNPSDNYEAQAQAGWSQQTNPQTSARQAVGALWETEEAAQTGQTDRSSPHFAQTARSETIPTPKPDKNGTDLHTLSLRMRDTLADLKNENPAQQATQKLFEQMKQTRDAMFAEMRTCIADFENRASAQQASIAQAVDQMNQEMTDIRTELEMMIVRYHEQNGDIHKAYTEHFAAERQRISRYREFLQFLLRERGT